jgi:DNA primase
MDTMRVDEVLGDFVHLKRRGTNLIANCPFHDEKSPSFVVSPAKGIYKCFGCSKSGNGVTFLMEHENLSYVDSIRHLARKYNIQLEETESTAEELQKNNEKESLFILNEFANKYFQKNLLENEIGKAIALSYFKERGFSDKTIQDFQLGYCLDLKDEMYKVLKHQGFKEEYILQLGLAKKYDDGGWRDFFKGRIMFPIHNLSGKVVGFGARVMGSAENTAKYLNSPENEIYHKSQVLYGMFLAKKGIPKENYCLLVEGYTDVISLYQGGIENAVASSGTALTIEQLKQIRRFTENLYILYDGDKAGIKAALRGMDLALENGLNVSLILLPEGHDPDSYVREYGGEALKQYIKETAADIVTFKAKLFREEAGNDPLKKAELTKNIIQTISLVSDNIKRSFYVKECAILMGIDEELINRETQMLINQKRKKQQTETRDKERQAEEFVNYESLPEDIAEDIKQLDTYSSNLIVIERELCKILVEHGDKPIEESQDDDNPFFGDIKVVEYIFKRHISNFVFESELCNKIFTHIKESYEQGNIFPLTHYINHIDTEISTFAISHCQQDNEVLMDWNKNKKNKNLKITNYGENYTIEIDHVLDQVFIAYLEKLSKHIMEITKQSIGNDLSLTEDAMKYLQIQQVFLEEFKKMREQLNYVFRKQVK